MRLRVGSAIYSVTGSWDSDSNATASNLSGPGRPLGQLLSSAGRRFEAVVDRTAARLGLGFEGVARRLFVKLRGPHVRCGDWPDFAKAPIVELAIELGSGRCSVCNKMYMSALDRNQNQDVDELLLRLVSSIE
jgi:hypothetical protein